jgi:glycosyltransferase involved in cell wall biosynthesis
LAVDHAVSTYPSMGAPQVSVIVPCLNERHHLGRALRNLLDGTFPAANMEVLVVDGGSTDGTRDIIARWALTEERVRLVENPRRTTPAALNLGIAAARGEIIVRADAHALYPRDYLEVLVRTLEESGADVVGCPADPAPGNETFEAETIALAARGLFATGSPFRNRRTSGDVDTVPFGCWRKSLFDRVGRFDERLLRNQDNEHTSRVWRSGGRVFLTAATRVRTVLRPTLDELWSHSARSGMWNAFSQRLFPYSFRWRHLLPGVFFTGVVFAALLIAVGFVMDEPPLGAVGLSILAPYLAANLLSSIWRAAASSRLSWVGAIAFVTASVHFTYGYGVAKGWWLVANGRWRTHLGDPAKESQ